MILLLVFFIGHIILTILVYRPLLSGICPKCGNKLKRGWTFNLITSFYCSEDRKHYNTDIDVYTVEIICIIKDIIRLYRNWKGGVA